MPPNAEPALWKLCLWMGTASAHDRPGFLIIWLVERAINGRCPVTTLFLAVPLEVPQFRIPVLDAMCGSRVLDTLHVTPAAIEGMYGLYSDS